VLPVVLALTCLLMSADTIRAQSLEVDHLWIHVSPGAPEAAALSAAGLEVDRNAGVVQHTGQGTASIFLRFQNVYLELIWIEDGALLQKVAP